MWLSRVKKRIFEVLELNSSEYLPSRVFAIFIMTLIILNVICVILETVDYFTETYATFFFIFEVFSVMVFSIEYILRIWTCTTDQRFNKPFRGRIQYALSPLALVDLIAILPFYLPMVFFIDLRFMRVLRLFRIIRVFKMVRYSHSLKIFINVFKAKKEEFTITFCIALILLILSSSLMFSFEHEAQPKVFPNIPATFWWSVITLTTVGYGDVYPVTPIGKLFGAIIAILGIGMVALPAGILASGFAEEIRKNQNIVIKCPHCGKEFEHDT